MMKSSYLNTRRNCRLHLWVAFVVLLAQRSPLSAQNIPAFVTDSLDTHIRNGIRDWKIPGLSIAIVKDGRVIYQKGFGVCEVGKTEAVDENTLFMIGSNTKAFTATALAMLEVDKKLSLQDKAQKWLPYFSLKDSLAGRDASLTDLLSHRLGLETFQGDFTFWTSSLSRQQIVEGMGRLTAPHSFRSKWGYSNAAYAACGEVVAKASGLSWDRYIKEKILLPLGMDRTCTSVAELTGLSHVAAPYTIQNDQPVRLPLGQLDNLGPAAAMSSTAKDMSTWLLTQLNSGRFENKQVIAETAIQKTHQPESIISADLRDGIRTHFYLYGLGFIITDLSGKVVISHTGGVDGFASAIMMVPEEKLGIVVLTNTDNTNFFQSLTLEVAYSFLGLPHAGYSNRVLKNTLAARKKTRNMLDSLQRVISQKKAPPFPIESVLGAYKNVLYGEISIKMEDGSPTISFSKHPGLKGRLAHLDRGIFLCTYSTPVFGIRQIPFVFDKGHVKGLTLTVADYIEATSYEFQKMED